MTARRDILKLSALGLATAAFPRAGFAVEVGSAAGATSNTPVVISTWPHGIPANEAAWKVLASGGRALDAVEQGVRVSEGDPLVDSVGYGGLPDRTGRVTLDACIMNEEGQCGSVAFLQEVKHPISVARLVMEKTPHVMLVGQGALDFALANGFERENLLTPASEAAWKKWQAEQATTSPAPGSAEDHDTIGMVALDAHGNLSGACTTSGLAWKLHGRVGDSPIIGAGLYVDNAVGAASATGVGEAVIRACGSFLVVELMRQGKSPQEACQLAIQRITEKTKNWREIQVGLIAVNKRGAFGAYSIAKGFQYAVHDTEHGNRLLPADSLLGK